MQIPRIGRRLAILPLLGATGLRSAHAVTPEEASRVEGVLSQLGPDIHAVGAQLSEFCTGAAKIMEAIADAGQQLHAAVNPIGRAQRGGGECRPGRARGCLRRQLTRRVSPFHQKTLCKIFWTR